MFAEILFNKDSMLLAEQFSIDSVSFGCKTDPNACGSHIDPVVIIARANFTNFYHPHIMWSHNLPISINNCK